MPKIDKDDLNNLGFVKEMFSLDDETFDTRLDAIISTAGTVISGRIGQSLYDSATEPTKSYVVLAEWNYAASELMSLRINKIISGLRAGGDQADTKSEVMQRDTYLDNYETMINNIQSIQHDKSFAFGTITTAPSDSILNDLKSRVY